MRCTIDDKMYPVPVAGRAEAPAMLVALGGSDKWLKVCLSVIRLSRGVVGSPAGLVLVGADTPVRTVREAGVGCNDDPSNNGGLPLHAAGRSDKLSTAPRPRWSVCMDVPRRKRTRHQRPPIMHGFSCFQRLAVLTFVGVMLGGVSAAREPATRGGILDLAEETFSRTPGLAERKALEARGQVRDMVESLVSATGIGGTTDAGEGLAAERIRRAGLPEGTHRGDDGTLIDVMPDGVVRFTTPDERRATILPNGRRFYQATRHSTVIDVDGSDDPGAFAAGKPPSPPPAPPTGKRAAAGGPVEGPSAHRDQQARSVRDAVLAIDRQIMERMEAWQEAVTRLDTAAAAAARNEVEMLEQSMRNVVRSRRQTEFPAGAAEIVRERFPDSLDEIQNGMDAAVEQWLESTQNRDGAAAAEARRRIDELRASRNQLYAGREGSLGPVRPRRLVATEGSPQDQPREEAEARPVETQRAETLFADESDLRHRRRHRDEQVRGDRESHRHAESGGGVAATPDGGRRHNTEELASDASSYFGRLDTALGAPAGLANGLGWDDLSGASSSASSEDWRIVVREEARPTYRPPKSGDDAVVSASRIPGSNVEVFVRESGARQVRLPDGTVVTTYPGLDNVNVTDATGRSRWLEPQDDGLVTSNTGSLGIAIDPETGRAFIVNQNAAGGRTVIEGDGAYSFTESDSSFQARRPDNSLDNAGYEDAGSGARVRYDAETGETRLYTPEGVLGGVRNDALDVFVNPATGERLPVNGLFRPPTATGNQAALSVWSTSQSESSSQRLQTFPSSAELAAQYVTAARQMITSNAQVLRAQGVSQEEIEKIRRDLGTMDTEIMVQRDLARLQRMAEARASEVTESGANPALAVIDAQITTAERTLEIARSEARRRREELSTARAAAAAAIREVNETVSSGERDLQLFITMSDPKIEKVELAGLEPHVKEGMEVAIRLARSSVDYSRFRCSPAGAPWDKCEHEEEKQRWLTAQMAAALKKTMGPALEAQVKRFDALKKKIAEKEQAIEERKKKQQGVKEQAEQVLKQEREQEKRLAEQIKALEKTLDQEIQTKDEAIFNLRQKRIEVAIRPKSKPQRSDLREFMDAMGMTIED